MMDFRFKKSNTKTDNWEQKIVIEENKQKAQIEIQGVDNGILVIYQFVKENGIWMLVEVNDKST